MTHFFQCSAIVPAPPERVYAAWIDGEEHTAMTGSAALSDPVIGGLHSAWNGYASGTYLELELGKKIVQTWRSLDFDDQDGDSVVEILFEPDVTGCRVTIVHSDIPEDQPDYKDGWIQYYFEPMKVYFGK